MAEIKVNGVSLSQIEDEALLAKLVTIHQSQPFSQGAATTATRAAYLMRLESVQRVMQRERQLSG